MPNTIENTVKALLEEALSEAYSITDQAIEVEIPANRDLGDFSTNIAMQLARTLKTNPRAIAMTLKDELASDALFSKVEVAGPGFINLFLADPVLHDILHAIMEDPAQYGASTIGEGTHVNIEFVSANPTGNLHVGHARGAAAGDNLARVMQKAGYTVTKEFYVNDGGNQILNLAKSIQARYEQLHGKDAKLPEDGYHGPEITTIAEALKMTHGDTYLHQDGLQVFRDFGVERLLEGLKEDLRTFGVTFDRFFSEASLYEADKVTYTLDKLKAAGHTYEEDGAIFLKTSAYGDDKDRVIVKSDGTYTYLMPDIAYHLDKLERGYDVLIDVLGADHHGYVPRLKAAIEMMSGKKDVLDVEMLQIVKVIKDGEEIKMSKRSGKAITLRDLIDEVGSDAIRYFFARHSLNTHMDLDLDLALKKTNENPVFYAQYAHARIKTLIKKARERGYDVNAVPKTFNHLSDDKTRKLLLALTDYPGVIEDAARTRNPHKIPNYVHSLASTLHTFYSAVPVMSEDPAASEERIYLLRAVASVIKDALSLVGVSAPDSM
ncbi:MAG: arginine--tRNA ligase [Candidatus Izemoplasmataceae bacterium]